MSTARLQRIRITKTSVCMVVEYKEYSISDSTQVMSTILEYENKTLTGVGLHLSMLRNDSQVHEVRVNRYLA